tara:strand:- start:3811 stop:4497 length:687 start_codon:yes stop_codon:yes gene_type:complete
MTVENDNVDASQDNTDEQQSVEDVNDSSEENSSTDEENQNDEGGEQAAGDQDDSSSDDEGNSDGEGDDQSDVPEEYTFELPEGMELDQELADKFSPIAKDAKLTNEQVNKIAPVIAEHLQEMATKQQNAWNDTVKGWGESLKSDADFGGANYNDNVEIAKTAISQFGGEELTKALQETGMGNHPALVKFALNVGKAISEDGFVEGGEQGNAGDKNSAQKLYNNSNMNP